MDGPRPWTRSRSSLLAPRTGDRSAAPTPSRGPHPSCSPPRVGFLKVSDAEPDWIMPMTWAPPPPCALRPGCRPPARRRCRPTGTNRCHRPARHRPLSAFPTGESALPGRKLGSRARRRVVEECVSRGGRVGGPSTPAFVPPRRPHRRPRPGLNEASPRAPGNEMGIAAHHTKPSDQRPPNPNLLLARLPASPRMNRLPMARAATLTACYPAAYTLPSQARQVHAGSRLIEAMHTLCLSRTMASWRCWRACWS